MSSKVMFRLQLIREYLDKGSFKVWLWSEGDFIGFVSEVFMGKDLLEITVRTENVSKKVLVEPHKLDIQKKGRLSLDLVLQKDSYAYEEHVQSAAD